MSNEIALPVALDVLEGRIKTKSSIDDLVQVLVGLQRLGLSREDLSVHIERMRAANDVTEANEMVEENALLALDLVHGLVGNHGLRWENADMAQVYLPRCISTEDLERSIVFAMKPSDLLPPRSTDPVPDEIVARLVSTEASRLREFKAMPSRADFYRVPKSSFTSRPAAVLGPDDRLVYEALAGQVADKLDSVARHEVVWPRGRQSHAGDYAFFVNIPREWAFDYVAIADVESYYESIDHSLLALFLERRFQMQRPYLHAIQGFLGAIMGGGVGLPQGPPGSEIFATAFLAEIDEYLVKNGWTFVRYADDYILGATSIVDARKKLESLESAMRDIGLRLNSDKTKLMRRTTFVGGLDRRSPRIAKFRSSIQDVAEETLRDSEDKIEMQRILEEFGLHEDHLWSLVYHQTASLHEIVEEFRNELTPHIVNTYARYFEQVVLPIDSDHLPGNMKEVEQDLRECLIFLASAQRPVKLLCVQKALMWFPRLAPQVSEYLVSIAPKRARGVRNFIARKLRSGTDTDTDWATAWVCQVLERSPSIVDSRLVDMLRSISTGTEHGTLTKSVAVRALAAAGSLDESLWVNLTGQFSDAMRAELLFAALTQREKYPWASRYLALGPAARPEGG